MKQQEAGKSEGKKFFNGEFEKISRFEQKERDIMRIAVMGTGGTGGYFGGLLARAGEEVAFIARGAHLEAIQKNGLTVNSKLHGDFKITAEATDNVREIGTVDCVLFCVKAYDNAEAADQISSLIGPQTTVLSVQNGIDNEEQIGSVVGRKHVVGCVSYVSSRIDSPGVIAQTAGPGKMVLGEMAGGTSPRTEALHRMLQNSGITAELHADIQAALWHKFLAICGINGVTALTRLPMGEIVACEETRAFLRNTMKEVEAVARTEGADLPGECLEQTMEFFSNMEPSLRGSMYYDLAAGRRLELDVLNGKVVDLGRKHGIPTESNFAIYAALKPYLYGKPSQKASQK